jgi:hypothetical protein
LPAKGSGDDPELSGNRVPSAHKSIPFEFTPDKEKPQMQPMTHDPGAVGIGAQVVANGTRGLAAGATATAAVTALAPAGADEVSAQAAVAFAAEGVETLAMNTFAQEEMTRAGAAYMEAAGIYTTVDSANAANF